MIVKFCLNFTKNTNIFAFFHKNAMTQTFRDIHKPYILCTCKILGIIPKFKNRQFIVPLKSFLYNSAISISNYTNRYLWTFFYYSKSTHNKSDSSKGLSRTFFSSATKPFVWNHNNIKARFKSTLAHSVRAFRSHISLRFEPGKKSEIWWRSSKLDKASLCDVL